MSGYLNRASLIGNLGADPEIRSLQYGSVASFSVATSESWKDKHTGERKERTEWHRVVIINNENLVRLAETYLKKGAKVFVEGQLKTRKWTDSSGVERYSTEIHLGAFNGTLTFLDSKRDAGERTAPRREPATAGAGSSSGADLDDDVPF